MLPRWSCVFSLYALQKSMMATPCGPSAVPTGGGGVAAPALIWILTTAATFFLAMGALCLGYVAIRYVPWRAQAANQCARCRPRSTNPGDLELGDLRELQLDGRLAAE